MRFAVLRWNSTLYETIPHAPNKHAGLGFGCKSFQKSRISFGVGSLFSRLPAVLQGMFNRESMLLWDNGTVFIVFAKGWYLYRVKFEKIQCVKNTPLLYGNAGRFIVRHRLAKGKKKRLALGLWGLQQPSGKGFDCIKTVLALILHALLHRMYTRAPARMAKRHSCGFCHLHP